MPDPASQPPPWLAASSEPAAPLPRRVQGATDRPPAPRIVQPEFSVEFLARVRAAIQAEAARSEQESGPGAALPHLMPGGNGSIWDASGRIASATGADGATGSAAGAGGEMPGRTAASLVDPARHTAPDGNAGRLAEPAPWDISRAGPVAPVPGLADPGAEPAAHRENPATPAIPAPGPAGQRTSQLGTGWRLQPGLGLRIAGLAALIIVVVGVLVVMLRPSAGRRGNSAETGPAAAARSSAAAWVAAQVSKGTAMSCDPAMCQALAAHRVPAADLHTLRPGQTGPLPAQLIIVTPVVRSEFGHRISSASAPELVARFGSGNQQVQVRVMAPAHAARYRAKLAADRAARRRSGAELARNPRLTMPRAARRQLAAGQVDPRVMSAVAGLAAQHNLRIVMFAGSGPGVAGSPLRAVELAAGSKPRQRLMRAMLHRESPRLRPEHIMARRLRGGQPALLVEFGAPSPLGVLGP